MSKLNRNIVIQYRQGVDSMNEKEILKLIMSYYCCSKEIAEVILESSKKDNEVELLINKISIAKVGK